MASVFLTAEWRSLAVLNYSIEAAVLAPWLPYGVELDLWQGEAMVSVVGFLFRRRRAFGVVWPGLTDFAFVAEGSPVCVRRGVRCLPPRARHVPDDLLPSPKL